MEVTKKEGMIYCNTPYNKSFVEASRRLNGRWKSPTWVFPEDIEEEVTAVLYDIYGYGSEKIDIIIEFKATNNYDTFSKSEVYIGGQVAFSRKCRDYEVSIGSGISILSGSFKKRGGSTNHPMVDTPEGELKIIFRNFPKNKLHELDAIATYEIKLKKEESKYADYTFDQLTNMMIDIKKEMQKRMEVKNNA